MSPGIRWPSSPKIQEKSNQLAIRLEPHDFMVARGGHLFRYLETEKNGNLRVSFVRGNSLHWIVPEDVIRKLSESDKTWLERRRQICVAKKLNEDAEDCQFLLSVL